MAIKVGFNITAIDNNLNFISRGISNIGSYTKAQLLSGSYNGTAVGDLTYCTDVGNGSIVTWNGTEWSGTKAAVISGGTPLNPGNGYNYFIFVSPGTLSVNGSGPVEYLIVAGGGGGGTGTGGGGGAGGVLSGSVEITGPQNIVVGNGAIARPFSQAAQNGSPSKMGSLEAIGGGAGISGAPSGTINGASPGGSGGGGGIYPGYMEGSGGGGIGGQGNPGGYAAPGGAGGGGAGSPGPTSGAGGAGSLYPAYAAPLISPAIPSAVRPAFVTAVGGGYYGGGGAGNLNTPNLGGTGGGGPAAGDTGNPGVDYTGGGGGGRWSYNSSSNGGGGGKGIVIVRQLQE